MVAQQDQQILVQDRGAAVTPVDVERRVLLSEVLRPHDATAHVERCELSCAEPDEQPLSVGDRCRRGEIVLLVQVGERSLRIDSKFPEAPAIGTVEGLHDQSDAVGVRARLLALAADRALPRDQGRIVAGEHRMRPSFQTRPPGLRRHEHLVAPDDRRRRPEAAKRCAPRDVLARAPRGRKG